MLTDIRLRSQQLARPEFKDPKDFLDGSCPGTRV